MGAPAGLCAWTGGKAQRTLRSSERVLCAATLRDPEMVRVGRLSCIVASRGCGCDSDCARGAACHEFSLFMRWVHSCRPSDWWYEARWGADLLCRRVLAELCMCASAYASDPWAEAGASGGHRRSCRSVFRGLSWTWRPQPTSASAQRIVSGRWLLPIGGAHASSLPKEGRFERRRLERDSASASAGRTCAESAAGKVRNGQMAQSRRLRDER